MPNKSKSKENLLSLRHTCEHILAQAMKQLYPEIIMAMGPATKDGFYFDFELPSGKISEADFPKIEKLMKKIIKENLPLKKDVVSLEKARKIFKNNPYKQEWLDEIEKKGEKATLFWTGDSFVDLCAGPHLVSTGKVNNFRLLSVAGAYWRGEEKNKMLTRIYGTAFPTKKELEEFLATLEEAKKRDHRKLNKTLKLYLTSQQMGPGLVTLLPNGAIIAEELEKWAKETEEKWGYIRVLTPHIAHERIFLQTGHLPYYAEHMYPPMHMEEKGEKEKGSYYVKPMNCAGHALVFKAEPRSYRDLPLRIAEYGAVYRYEDSGELHGMMRVRGPIHQNDAHIFCTEDQAEEEFQKVMALHQYYYQTLGLGKKDYFLSFATRDKENKKKYLGDDEMWNKAEKITLEYIKKSDIPYEIEPGGAAFYGPKIDFNIKTVTGKVFSASTNQLDFFIPRVFSLKYIDKDGQERTPVCIHRAPLGAHVRFIAFLTEHFVGAFPVWLSPCQVCVLPITEKQTNYAVSIKKALEEKRIRVKMDDNRQTLSYRIRQAELEKIPFLIIVGPKEEKENTISIRERGGQEIKSRPIKWFVKAIEKLIKEKSLNLILKNKLIK